MKEESKNKSGKSATSKNSDSKRGSSSKSNNKGMQAKSPKGSTRGNSK